MTTTISDWQLFTSIIADELTCATTVEEISVAMVANGEAFRDGKIDPPTFHARQRKLWDRARAEGVEKRVLAYLLAELPPKETP